MREWHDLVVLEGTEVINRFSDVLLNAYFALVQKL